MKWFSPKPPPPSLQPILTLGPGRTGSTLLMELLLTSPAVAPEPLFPHENRMLTAIAASSLAFWKVPDELPWDLRDMVSAMHASMEARQVWPWRSDAQSRDQGEELLWSQFLRAKWDLLGKRLRQRQPQAAFYAEKGSQGLAWILKKAGIPHRVILRCRDPRDVWCSLQSFAERRGYELQGPDQPLVTPDERLPGFLQRMEQRYASIPKGALVLRYEDMVSDLPATAARLESWLGAGVKLNPDLALERAAAHPAHRTTESPAASIGRWRRDIQPRHLDAIQNKLAPVMQRLGYEAADSSE